MELKYSFNKRSCNCASCGISIAVGKLKLTHVWYNSAQRGSYWQKRSHYCSDCAQILVTNLTEALDKLRDAMSNNEQVLIEDSIVTTIT